MTYLGWNSNIQKCVLFGYQWICLYSYTCLHLPGFSGVKSLSTHITRLRKHQRHLHRPQICLLFRLIILANHHKWFNPQCMLQAPHFSSLFIWVACLRCHFNPHYHHSLDHLLCHLTLIKITLTWDPMPVISTQVHRNYYTIHNPCFMQIQVAILMWFDFLWNALYLNLLWRLKKVFCFVEWNTRNS